ncbi:MAG: hypothetical protein QOJ00_751 [Actinomycetota bacterium]
MQTKHLALDDMRVAGALMLVAGAGRALMHSHVGVPCPLRMLTGVPCPLCGMTTSVTASVRGDVIGAIAANPAGPLVVIAAVLLLVIPRRHTLDVPRWILPVALVLMWVWELFRFNLI